MDAQPPERESPPPVDPATRIFYGLGSIAYGVKDSGFSFFLLFFYNQVLGLPSQIVGLGILLTQILDAISDPIVGYVSDNWHSRWGRRQPFMYFTAIPVGIGFYLLFHPPEGLDQTRLFIWFVFFAALVRTLITLYEIPSSSLVAELTDDYDERTAMMSYRYFFGWSGGLTMSIMALGVFFVSSAAYPNGQLDPRGYGPYGMAAGAVIAIAILISAIGTHHRIPTLRAPPAKQRFDARRVAGELRETLGNRSFLVLFFAGIFSATAGGLTSALNIYFNTFFWGLSSQQISYLYVSIFGAAAIGLFVPSRLSRHIGKRNAALLTGGLSIFVAPMPLIGRLLGWMPENGSSELLPILMLFSVVDVSFFIMTGVLVSSMVADVVEESELRTGRRSEGTFFAARSFAQKAVSGVGVLGSTLILSLVGFPEGARTAQEVSPEVLRDLALVYIPSFAILYAAFLALLASYRISRDAHAANLETLSGRAS